MKKSVKIGLCVVLGLVIAGGVCAGLVISNNAKEKQKEELKAEFAKMRTESTAIFSDKGAIEKFLDTKVKAAKLSEEEQKIVSAFEEVAKKDNPAQKLQEMKAYEDERAKALVDEAVKLYENITSLYLLEQDMSTMFDGELSEEDLKKLSESKSDYLKTMAKDVTDYREKVKKLSAKDNEFEKNYKALVTEGESLIKKYADVKLEDPAGKSKSELLAFYDKIDELNKYLAEQE